jgi:hypothetical protein
MSEAKQKRKQKILNTCVHMLFTAISVIKSKIKLDKNKETFEKRDMRNPNYFYRGDWV